MGASALDHGVVPGRAERAEVRLADLEIKIAKTSVVLIGIVRQESFVSESQMVYQTADDFIDWIMQ